jgi:hypothetical protein
VLIAIRSALSILVSSRIISRADEIHYSHRTLSGTGNQRNKAFYDIMVLQLMHDDYDFFPLPASAAETALYVCGRKAYRNMYICMKFRFMLQHKEVYHHDGRRLSR